VARYRAEIAAVADMPIPAAPMPVVEPVVGEAPAARSPAGFWIRAVAMLIDVVVLFTMQAMFGFLVVFLLHPTSPRLMAAAVAAFRLVSDSVYFVVLYWLWGQTFGKMIMQIRVVTVAGDSISLGQSGLRWLGYIASTVTLGIGYLMAGLRPDKRALHDLMAGTRVERLS
jgi:uncharacterized RDD family membrane protein YckC